MKVLKLQWFYKCHKIFIYIDMDLLRRYFKSFVLWRYDRNSSLICFPSSTKCSSHLTVKTLRNFICTTYSLGYSCYLHWSIEHYLFIHSKWWIFFSFSRGYLDVLIRTHLKTLSWPWSILVYTANSSRYCAPTNHCLPMTNKYDKSISRYHNLNILASVLYNR